MGCYKRGDWHVMVGIFVFRLGRARDGWSYKCIVDPVICGAASACCFIYTLARWSSKVSNGCKGWARGGSCVQCTTRNRFAWLVRRLIRGVKGGAKLMVCGGVVLWWLVVVWWWWSFVSDLSALVHCGSGDAFRWTSMWWWTKLFCSMWVVTRWFVVSYDGCAEKMKVGYVIFHICMRKKIMTWQFLVGQIYEWRIVVFGISYW